MLSQSGSPVGSKSRAIHLENYPVDDLLDDGNCNFDHLSVSNRSPILELSLYGFSFPALVDTGSEISAISEDVWNRFPENLKADIPCFPCTGVRITGAFKSKQKKIQLQSLIIFSCNGNLFKQEFFLVNDLIYPIILGIDFLRIYQVTIDLKNNFLACMLNGNIVKLPEKKYFHEYEGYEKINLRCIPKYEVLACATLSVEKDTDSNNTIKHFILSQTEQEIFQNLLDKNKFVFSNVPGCVKNYVHEIRMIDKNPFFIKPYPIPVAYRVSVNETVKEMERLGIIERAATSYISPVAAVIKRDGTIRLCLDARRLNSQMERDHEAPRPIEQILNTLNFDGTTNRKYFSRLDATNGYWQIPLAPESRKYTGFMIDSKTYVFRVLPFGLSTASSSFVRMISRVFGPEFDSFLIAYIDDILIISNSFNEHISHLKLVFDRLNEVGLTLKLKKCAFFCTELPFLGYILNSEGIKPDPTRIEAITSYPRPKNIKQLQRFLGMCNFDRSFCQSFSGFCEPLSRLLRKKIQWEWKDEQEQAFNKIKHELSQATILYHPNLSSDWHVSVDASEYGLGAHLFQIVENQQRTVAWASRLLLPRETRYHSNEKEVLACIFALTRWRIYLLGCHFTIHTDNRVLTYIKSCRLLSPRISRWALALQEYDFSVEFLPGKNNIIADALSRDAFTIPESSDSRCFKILSTIKLPLDFQRKLKSFSKLQREDKKLADIISQLEVDSELQKRFLIHEDTLYKRQAADEPCLVCVPKHLQREFVEAFHSMLGHYGVYKTWSALRHEVWWPNMHSTIKQVLRCCDSCQKSKSSIMPKPPLNPVIPEGKGDLVALDLYGPLPKSRGGVSYILVVLDVFTKYVALYSLKKATCRAVLNKLILDYFPKNGRPVRILSDHGSQFTAKRWRETLEALSIKVIFSSVRHPQANASERVMRELGRLCRVYCAGHHTRWAYEIQNFSELMNSVVHESTGFSPNELHRNITTPNYLPATLVHTPNVGKVSDKNQRLLLAKETLISRAARRKINHPHRPYPTFNINDLVLLRANTISSALSAETKKFLLLFEGPFRIKKKVSFDTYVLMDDKNVERGTFHVSHLKAYHFLPP